MNDSSTWHHDCTLSTELGGSELKGFPDDDEYDFYECYTAIAGNTMTFSLFVDNVYGDLPIYLYMSALKRGVQDKNEYDTCGSMLRVSKLDVPYYYGPLYSSDVFSEIVNYKSGILRTNLKNWTKVSLPVNGKPHNL